VETGHCAFQQVQHLTYIDAVLLVTTRQSSFISSVFTARRYASVVDAVVVCLCVSVCLSHTGIVSKRLN